MLGLTLPSSTFIWCPHLASSTCEVSLQSDFSLRSLQLSQCSFSPTLVYCKRLLSNPRPFSRLHLLCCFLLTAASSCSCGCSHFQDRIQIPSKSVQSPCNLSFGLPFYLFCFSLSYHPNSLPSVVRCFCLSSSLWNSGKEILECFPVSLDNSYSLENSLP